MNSKIALTLGVMFIMAVSAFSQEIWTLEKCLEYAYQNSPKLKVAENTVKQAEGQAQSASSILYPQVNLSASYTKNSPAPFGGLGGTVPTGRIRPSLVSAEVYEYLASLNYTLFSWRIKPTLEIASAGVDIAQKDYQSARDDLTLQVKQAYYASLFTRQLVKISSKAEEVAKDNYETTQRLYDEGQVSHFDVSRAKVRWVNSQSDRIEVERNQNLALENLKTLLSLPDDQDFAVTGSLPEELAEVNLEEGLQTAQAKRSEIQSLNSLENLSKSTVNLEKGTRMPSLSLGYNYSWQANDGYVNPDRYYKSWTLLGKISYPLFDGFNAKGKIRAARAGLERVKESKQQLLDAIALQVKEAFLSMKSAQDRIISQRENVATAQENLRIATERYKLGLLSQLELKDAELSLVESETNYNKALYDYNTSLAAWQRAQGID
ncbi:MAG: hypothetical protein A2Z27_04065 [candidate division Zixibacteria bacterium RBG_16_50_21]|nr:MAG: hypothetical protein A2Z27_04065 [candidate division Zixibacteria bacterium RBG_16_50_21]